MAIPLLPIEAKSVIKEVKTSYDGTYHEQKKPPACSS